jgi:hypothetical protein
MLDGTNKKDGFGVKARRVFMFQIACNSALEICRIADHGNGRSLARH